jgi:transposase
MKKKHTYKTIDVQQVQPSRLLGLLPAALVIVAIDVAKQRQVAALCDPQGQDQVLVRFEHPEQTPRFMDLVGSLQSAQKQVQVVMEPTGTYGDILCYQAFAKGLEVYQVSPKRTHDAAEVFDGVPSYHDAKDATVIARLHAQGASRRWSPQPEQRRELRALVARRELHAKQHEVLQGELEGLLARHWPEGQRVLSFRRQRSALQLLEAYPDPHLMAAQPEQVRQLLERASRGHLPAQTLHDLLEALPQSQGVPLVEGERELLRELARELLRTGQRIQELDQQLKEQVQGRPALAQVGEFVGTTTAAVLEAYLGQLGAYPSAAALDKAMGLNLKEASSGRQSQSRYRPGVHITNRGPGIVRKYLYLATLRWMQQDPVAAAWYKRRQGYTEQSKGGAVVALMRKLVRGLWHLSRGLSYQPERLFDVPRLRPEPKPGSPAEQEVTMEQG